MEKKVIKIELLLKLEDEFWIMYDNVPYKFGVKDISLKLRSNSQANNIKYECISNKYGQKTYINLWEINNRLYTEESNINSRIEIFETKEELINSLFKK